MRKMLRAALGVALLAALVLPAVASDQDEITVSGKIVCAKCTLKKEDAKECQSVLVVEGDHAGEYYVVNNEVAEEYGHICSGSKDAVVTGTVTEKDGRKWIAATKMESPQQG